MPAITSGSLLPLFERIAANGDAQPLGEDELRASIARELARLLNTRSHLTCEQFDKVDGTVIDYGVPDFSERSLRSGPDRDAIAAAVRRSIALFEPRLSNVVVGFALPAENKTDPVLVIGGDIRMGSSLRHVSFEMEPDGGSTDPRWANHG